MASSVSAASQDASNPQDSQSVEACLRTLQNLDIQDTESVESCLQAIQDINIQDDGKKTIMHHAALADDISAISLLHSHGASLTIQDERGATPLHLAICRGNGAAAQRLAGYLSKGLIDIRDMFGLTPLHQAIRLGDSLGVDNHDTIRTLLSKGADLVTKIHSGRSALEEASRLHSEQIWAILTDYRRAINVERNVRDRRWSRIRAFMVQNFADPNAASAISKLHVYTDVHNACTYCKANRGNPSGAAAGASETLYWNIRDCIAEQVHELACAANCLSNDQLCDFYSREWRRLERVANNHINCFRYLERHFIQRELDERRTDVHLIKELHYIIWKERFFFAVPLLVPTIADLFEKSGDGRQTTQRQKEIFRSSFSAMSMDYDISFDEGTGSLRDILEVKLPP